MFNDMSLRARLMLMTLAAIFLPLIVSGIFFCLRERDNIYDSQKEYLLNSSKHICQDIDYWISRQKIVIRTVAENDFIRNLANSYAQVGSDPKKIAELQRRFMEKADIMNKSMPQISEIYLSTLGDAIIYDNKLASNPSLSEISPDEQNHIVYPGGFIYLSTNKSHLGEPWLPNEQIKKDPTIIDKLNKGEVVLSQRSLIDTEITNCNTDPNHDNTNRHANSYMSVFVYKEPIEYYDGNADKPALEKRTPIAILSFRIKPFSTNSFAEHNNFYIVDKDGQIVVMPKNITNKDLKSLKPKEASDVLDPKIEIRTYLLNDPKGENTQPFKEYSNYRTPKNDHSDQEDDSPEQISSSNAIEEVYKNIFGQDVIGAWSACEQIDWFVLTEKTKQELFSSLWKSIIVSVLITVSIGAAFIVLAFFTANSLVKPIAELSKAANKIAGGDHTTRCHITRRDEIGQLASAFDSMASRIEKAMSALKKARDEAMEANLIKSRFLANMSHELRTPLNAIIGYSEMLIEDAEDRQDKNAVQDLQNIHIAGLNLLSNINDILNISKLESGKVNLFIEKFPLSELIMELRASTNSLYQVNNNKFELDCPNSEIVLNTDHAKLRQILINLLGNAVKFTKDGIIRLSIEIWDSPKAQNEFYPVPFLNSPGYAVVEADFKPDTKVVVISVQDNGIGMTPEKFSKIFEEFTQADDSISRSYGGTGLGLALVRHYSHILKARLELISKENVGSAFTIKIPLIWEEGKSTETDTSQECTVLKAK